MRKIVLIIFVLAISLSLFAGMGGKIDRSIDPAGRKITDEEKITLSRTTNFSVALKAIEKLSQEFEGKKILNTSKFDDAIGTPLNQLYWKDALKLIVYYNNLILEELPGVFLVKDQPEEDKAEEEKKVTISDKMIEIGAVFFQMDKSFLNNLGIDWSTITDGSVIAKVSQTGATKIQNQIISAGVGTVIDNGDMRINLDALLKMIESNQNGTVIARPKITVISGKKGRIQVGEDFSVKTTDESGNTTDKFFSTGVIMEVTPTYISDEKSEGIHLIANVEKSSANPGEISTVIPKSKTNTEVILFNGEETVMAGLYDTDESIERGGIPILKDLPWWFLGIRYLTGYEIREVKKREMIIVLSAKIMDNIEKRIKNNRSIETSIDDFRESNRKIHKIFEMGDVNENQN